MSRHRRITIQELVRYSPQAPEVEQFRRLVDYAVRRSRQVRIGKENTLDSNMLLAVTSLVFSFIDVISPFQFPINQHSKVGNILEGQIRRSPHSNEVVDCHVEDILNIIALDDLQILIEGLASRTAISPFLILRKLHRRMLNRDGVNEILMDTFDGSPLTETPAQTVLDFPAESKIPPEASRVPYSLSPHVSVMDANKGEDIVIVPVAPSSMNRVPSMVKMGHIVKDSTFASHRIKPVVEEMSNMLPGVFSPPLRHNRIKPPLGATVRVDGGDPLNPITREIAVTVSPLMTFIEAMRQVERKYQNALGLSDDTEVITFAHSAAVDCYIINSIADIAHDEQSGWQVTITDRDNKVVYDSFCLPGNNEVLIKPGSEISLSYVPI